MPGKSGIANATNGSCPVCSQGPAGGPKLPMAPKQNPALPGAKGPMRMGPVTLKPGPFIRPF